MLNAISAWGVGGCGGRSAIQAEKSKFVFGCLCFAYQSIKGNTAEPHVHMSALGLTYPQPHTHGPIQELHARGNETVKGALIGLVFCSCKRGEGTDCSPLAD